MIKKSWIIAIVMSLTFSSCDGLSNRRNSHRVEDKSRIEQLKQEETDVIVEASSIKPKVNVYIENSGSMDGYVKGINEFKDAIGKLLVQLKYHYDEENVQVFFICNNKSDSNIQVTQTAIGMDLANFASEIDVKWRDESKKRGHNTNLNNVFKEVLSRTNDSCISILISDCIYSIGDGSTVNLLNHEKNTTYDAFLTKSKNNPGDLATTIVKMKSKFDGKYYPYTGDKNAFLFKGELPYYICVIANQNVLDDFNNNIKLDSGAIDGYDNKYIITRGVNTDIYYTVLMATGNKGRFKSQRNISSQSFVHGIKDIDLKPNKREGAPFTFAVAIDMKSLDVEEDYILDTSNYILSEDNFEITEIKKVVKNEINPNDWQRIKDANPTHIVMIQARDMQWTNVELGISLKKQVPQWIEDSSILDDTKPDNLKGGKSFGLKYWIEGISEAYEKLYPDDKNYFEVIINISKK